MVLAMPDGEGQEPVKGKRGRKPRLTDAQVDAICFAYRGLTDQDVATIYGVSKMYVWYLRNGRRRVQGRKKAVTYKPLPVEVLEAIDLDRWFVHRARALLRGYVRAREEFEASQRFNPPDEKSLEVDDGLDAAPEERLYGIGGLERAILGRAKKRTQRQIAEAAGRQKPDQHRAKPSQGELPAPSLLYDSKR